MIVELNNITESDKRCFVDITSYDLELYYTEPVGRWRKNAKGQYRLDEDGNRIENKSFGKDSKTTLGYYTSFRDLFHRLYTYRLSEIKDVIDDLDKFKNISENILTNIEKSCIDIQESFNKIKSVKE